MTPVLRVALCAAALVVAGCDRIGALSPVAPFRSFESSCAALPPGRIEVVHVRKPVVEDYSLGNADLERLAESTEAHHRTVGLTRAQFGYRSTLELDGLEDARGGRSCASPRVRVEIASAPMTVYVAHEYHGDPCREPLILDHERRHVAVFEDYGIEAAPVIARDLEARIGAGPRYARTMADAQEALRAELTTYLDEYMSEARDELAARHALVDTEREYEMLARSCGATPDPVR